MSSKNGDIPIYSADGRSLGFRAPEAVRKLLAAGSVNPVYGPRKQLKGLFLKQEDGANSVEAHLRPGTRYSFEQRLDSGHHNWRHKRIAEKGEDGRLVSTRGAFLEVVRECMR